MGMIANYQYISDEDLNELKNIDLEDIIDKVEDLSDEDVLLDIDKMWDVLHFVLTGVDSGSPIENNYLSEAVVGTTSFDDVAEFIAYIEKDRVLEIVNALEEFDIRTAMDVFSMKECKEVGIYPNIWDYEEDIDDIKEEITDYFEMMKNFYKKVLDMRGNVLITIY